MYDVLVILTTFIRETKELEFGGHVDIRPDLTLHTITCMLKNWSAKTTHIQGRRHSKVLVSCHECVQGFTTQARCLLASNVIDPAP